MSEVRVIVRLKNNKLIKIREKLGFTLVQMGHLLGMHASVYQDFENLKRHPNDSDPSMDAALKMEGILEVPLEKLFPKSLTKLKVNRIIKEVSVDNLQRITYEPAQVLQIENSQLKTQINKAFKKLTVQQVDVLNKRFGLNGIVDEFTLNEVADSIDRSPERIRQVEAKALRILRNPRNTELIEWNPREGLT